jgi:hypothetical protein
LRQRSGFAGCSLRGAATSPFCLLIYASPAFLCTAFFGGCYRGLGNRCICKRKEALFAWKRAFSRKSWPVPAERGPPIFPFLPPNERFQSLSEDFPSGVAHRSGEAAARDHGRSSAYVAVSKDWTSGIRFEAV